MPDTVDRRVSCNASQRAFLRVTGTLLALAILSAGAMLAEELSYSGFLTDGEQVVMEPITLTTISNLVVQTLGYGGGWDPDGKWVPEGGFEPVIGVFQGSSSSAVLIGINAAGSCPPGTVDSVSGFCGDDTLELSNLAPGHYIVTLSEILNSPNGPTLGDGFFGYGDFFDIFGNPRTQNYDFDVTITPTNPVPEPKFSVLWAIVASALGIASIRRLQATGPR
jgi:hypothetical protein